MTDRCAQKRECLATRRRGRCPRPPSARESVMHPPVKSRGCHLQSPRRIAPAPEGAREAKLAANCRREQRERRLPLHRCRRPCRPATRELAIAKMAQSAGERGERGVSFFCRRRPRRPRAQVSLGAPAGETPSYRPELHRTLEPPGEPGSHSAQPRVYNAEGSAAAHVCFVRRLPAIEGAPLCEASQSEDSDAHALAPPPPLCRRRRPRHPAAREVLGRPAQDTTAVLSPCTRCLAPPTAPAAPAAREAVR